MALVGCGGSTGYSHSVGVANCLLERCRGINGTSGHGHCENLVQDRVAGVSIDELLHSKSQVRVDEFGLGSGAVRDSARSSRVRCNLGGLSACIGGKCSSGERFVEHIFILFIKFETKILY